MTSSGTRRMSSPHGTSCTKTGTAFDPSIPELAVPPKGDVRLSLSAMEDGLQVDESDDAGETSSHLGSAGIFGADPSAVQGGDGGWALFYKTVAPPN